MSQSTHKNFASLRVLCIGGDPLMRSIVRSALQQRGCREVVYAAGGLDALDLCAGRTFDLIVCDFQIGPMSGLEFLRAFAASGLGEGWPIVMVGSESDPAIVRETQELGVSGWVDKPISVQALTDRIAGLPQLHGHIAPSCTAGESLAATERSHARLLVAIAAAEEMVRGLRLRAREAASIGQNLRPVLDGVDEYANALGYGLVVALSGRVRELATAMSGNPAAAIRGHADASRAFGTLITAMKRVAQNRMAGDGGEAGATLLGKIKSIVDPVRAGFG
jgi:two-component system chemotaxis response regulator CheY